MAHLTGIVIVKANMSYSTSHLEHYWQHLLDGEQSGNKMQLPIVDNIPETVKAPARIPVPFILNDETGEGVSVSPSLYERVQQTIKQVKENPDSLETYYLVTVIEEFSNQRMKHAFYSIESDPEIRSQMADQLESHLKQGNSLESYHPDVT